jgi:hypothetical protein
VGEQMAPKPELVRAGASTADPLDGLFARPLCYIISSGFVKVVTPHAPTAA